MTEASRSVYVVDDDAAVRTSMLRLLALAGYSVATFESGGEFFGRCTEESPACVLLDLRMPSVSGLQVMEALSRRDSCLGVILMSGVGDVASSVKAIKLGALDFLTKPVDETLLLKSVESAWSVSADRHLKGQEQADLRQRFDTLTPREREVCHLVARGLPNREIALELGSAEKTIKIHRGRVMRKLQAPSVAMLVRLVDRLKTSG